MIENYLLEYLVSFSKNKTLSKTAEQFNVTPASISRGLQKLEKELGVAILDHQPHKLSLTSAGKYTVELAKNILKKQYELIPAVQNFVKNEITISATLPDPLMILKDRIQNNPIYLFPPALLNPEDCQNALLSHQVDLIFSTQKINTPQIHSTFIDNVNLYIKITKFNSLYTKDSVSFSDLNNHEFVVYDKIGIWKNLIQTQIPKAMFIFQNEQKSVDELIEKSNFPIFQTNLSIKAMAHKKLQDHKRKLIPISDPEAHLEIYANYRINEKDKVSKLILLSQKVMS